MPWLSPGVVTDQPGFSHLLAVEGGALKGEDVLKAFCYMRGSERCGLYGGVSGERAEHRVLGWGGRGH